LQLRFQRTKRAGSIPGPKSKGRSLPGNCRSSQCQNFRTEPFNVPTAGPISSSPRASKVFSTIRISKTNPNVAGLASKSGKGRGTAAMAAWKPPPTVPNAVERLRCRSGQHRVGLSSAASASKKGNPLQPRLHRPNQRNCWTLWGRVASQPSPASPLAARAPEPVTRRAPVL